MDYVRKSKLNRSSAGQEEARELEAQERETGDQGERGPTETSERETEDQGERGPTETSEREAEEQGERGPLKTNEREAEEQEAREQLETSVVESAASGEAELQTDTNIAEKIAQAVSEREALLSKSVHALKMNGSTDVGAKLVESKLPSDAEVLLNQDDEANHEEQDDEAVGAISPLTGKTGKLVKPPRSGEIVAGLLSAVLGMAALTASHWWSAADPAHANLWLIRLSSWLPGGLRIGPYGGKELTALAVWLGSWLILFLALKWFELRIKPWIYVFSIAVVILLVLLWPPVYHKIYGWPA
jgi:hypothetical protein